LSKTRTHPISDTKLDILFFVVLMNQDNNQPNESRESSIQDAQDRWYSHLTTSPDPSFHTTTSSSTPMENDM
jgi:hypothetical protein